MAFAAKAHSLGWGRPVGQLTKDADAHKALGWGGPAGRVAPKAGTRGGGTPADHAHIARPHAQACFAELEATLKVMEAMEEAGELAQVPGARSHVTAVIALRDRLELYIETAAPGTPYPATVTDMETAKIAAAFLEAWHCEN